MGKERFFMSNSGSEIELTSRHQSLRVRQRFNFTPIVRIFYFLSVLTTHRNIYILVCAAPNFDFQNFHNKL